MNRIVSTNPSIEEAYQKAGGRRKVRESLGVTKASLSDWLRSGRVPPVRAGELEKLSGVSRRKLCPDFDWGPLRVKAEPRLEASV